MEDHVVIENVRKYLENYHFSQDKNIINEVEKYCKKYCFLFHTTSYGNTSLEFQTDLKELEKELEIILPEIKYRIWILVWILPRSIEMMITFKQSNWEYCHASEIVA